MLEDAAEGEGVGAALGAFETSDATQVIRCLFRLDAVFT